MFRKQLQAAGSVRGPTKRVGELRTGKQGFGRAFKSMQQQQPSELDDVEAFIQAMSELGSHPSLKHVVHSTCGLKSLGVEFCHSGKRLDQACSRLNQSGQSDVAFGNVIILLTGSHCGV